MCDAPPSSHPPAPVSQPHGGATRLPPTATVARVAQGREQMTPGGSAALTKEGGTDCERLERPQLTSTDKQARHWEPAVGTEDIVKPWCPAAEPRSASSQTLPDAYPRTVPTEAQAGP